jgi:hypothetical protein
MDQKLFGAVIKNLNRYQVVEGKNKKETKRDKNPTIFDFCNGSAMNSMVTCRFYTAATVVILFYLMFCYLRMNILL